MTKHKDQISKFLTKNLKKIAIPFINLLKGSKFVKETAQKTIKLLPNLSKKDKTEELFSFALPNIQNSTKKTQKTENVFEKNTPIEQIFFRLPTNNKNEVKLPVFLPNKLAITLPIQVKNKESVKNNSKSLFFDVINALTTKNLKQNINILKSFSNKSQVLPLIFGNSTEKSTNTNKSIPKNNKIEAKPSTVNKIEAKLSPNTTTAGGKEGAKVVILGNQNPSSPKEAALVGEAGKERIIHSTGSVIPLGKTKTLSVPPAYNFSTQKYKEDNSKIQINPKTQTKTIKQIVPILGDSDKKLKDILITTGKPSIQIKNAITVQNSKAQENSSPLQFYNYHGILNEPQIEMSQSEKEEIASLAENKKISNTIQKLPSGQTVIRLPGYAEGKNQQSNITPTIGNIGGGIGEFAKKAFNASPLGMAASAISGFFGGGDDAKEKQEDKRAVVSQGNLSTPTNITNISYQYDTYRKTAEDSFMLPNFRREYG